MQNRDGPQRATFVFLEIASCIDKQTDTVLGKIMIKYKGMGRGWGLCGCRCCHIRTQPILNFLGPMLIPILGSKKNSDTDVSANILYTEYNIQNIKYVGLYTYFCNNPQFGYARLQF